jgi:hypothetical protein
MARAPAAALAPVAGVLNRSASCWAVPLGAAPVMVDRVRDRLGEAVPDRAMPVIEGSARHPRHPARLAVRPAVVEAARTSG